MLAVVDGSEQGEYDGLACGSLRFSPDSRRLAYAAKRGDKPFVVVDGHEEAPYDAVADILFSPDSRRIAYGAQRGGKQFVVVDGHEEREYDGVEDLLFSPDSRRVAYCARRGEKQFLVVDGVEGEPYDGFPSDSRLVFDSPNTLSHLAIRGIEMFLLEVETRQQ
jgi:hypothetical protein